MLFVLFLSALCGVCLAQDQCTTNSDCTNTACSPGEHVVCNKHNHCHCQAAPSVDCRHAGDCHHMHCGKDNNRVCVNLKCNCTDKAVLAAETCTGSDVSTCTDMCHSHQELVCHKGQCSCHHAVGISGKCTGDDTSTCTGQCAFLETLVCTNKGHCRCHHAHVVG